EEEDEPPTSSSPMSSNPPPVVPKPALISSSSAVSNAGPKPARPSASSGPGGLDLDRPVALEPGGGRDQLADDHVLLQAGQAVDLALERGVGEHLRRLLEGGGGEERVRPERRLRDAEDDLLELRQLAAGRLDLAVRAPQLVPVHEL